MENDEELKNTTPSIESSEKNTPIIENTDDLGPAPDAIISARNFGEENFNEPNEEPSQELPLNDDDYASEENEEGTRVLNSSKELREEFGPSVFDSGFTSESENQPQTEQDAQKSFEEEGEPPTIISQTVIPEDWDENNPNYFEPDAKSAGVELNAESAKERPSIEPNTENLEVQIENSPSPEKQVKIQSADDFIPSASLDRTKDIPYSDLEPLVAEVNNLIGANTVVYNTQTNIITIRPNTSVEDLQKIISYVKPGAQIALEKSVKACDYDDRNGLSRNSIREKIQISPALLSVLGDKIESMTIKGGVDLEYLNSGDGDIWSRLPNLRNLQIYNNKGVPCNIDGTGAFKEHPNLSCVSMCLDDNGFLSEGFCQGTALASFQVFEAKPGEAHSLEMEDNVLFGSAKNNVKGVSRDEWNRIHDTVLKCDKNDNSQNKEKNEEFVKDIYNKQINGYNGFIQEFESRTRYFYNANIKAKLEELNFPISDKLNQKIGILGQIGNPPQDVRETLGNLQKEISKSSLSSAEKREISTSLKIIADLQGQAYDAIQTRDGLIARRDNLNLGDSMHTQLPSRLKAGDNCCSCRTYDYVSSTDPNGRNYNKSVEKERRDLARNTIRNFYAQAALYDNSTKLRNEVIDKELYNFLVDFNNAKFKRSQGKRKGEEVGRLNFFGTEPRDYETREANGLTVSSSLQETYEEIIKNANEIKKNTKCDYLDAIEQSLDKRLGSYDVFNKYLNEIYNSGSDKDWKERFNSSVYDKIIDQYAKEIRLKYGLSDNNSRSKFVNKEFSVACAREALKLVHDFNTKIPKLKTQVDIDNEIKKIEDRINNFVNVDFLTFNLLKDERTDLMNAARSEFREVFKSIGLDEKGNVIDFEEYRKLEDSRNVVSLNPGCVFGDNCLSKTNLNGIAVNENIEAYKHFVAHAKNDLEKAEDKVFESLYLNCLGPATYIRNWDNLSDSDRLYYENLAKGYIEKKEEFKKLPLKDKTAEKKAELANIREELWKNCDIKNTPVGEYKRLIEGHVHDQESHGKQDDWLQDMLNWKAAQKAYEEYCTIRTIVENSGTKENWLAQQSFAKLEIDKKIEDFEKANSTRKTKINGVDLYEMNRDALSPENRKIYDKLLEERAEVVKNFDKVVMGEHCLSEGKEGGAEKTMMVGKGVNAGADSFRGNPETIEIHDGSPETMVTTDVIKKNLYRDSDIFRGRLMCLADRVMDAFDSRNFRFVRLEEALLETLINLLKILFHIGRSCYEFGAKQYRNRSINYFEKSAKESRELLLMMGKDGVNVIERLCSPSVPDSEYNALAKMVGSYQLNNILNSKTSTIEKNQAIVKTLSERCAVLEKKRDDIKEAIESSQLSEVQKRQVYEMLGKYNFKDGVTLLKKLKEQTRRTMSEKPRTQSPKVKVSTPGK